MSVSIDQRLFVSSILYKNTGQFELPFNSLGNRASIPLIKKDPVSNIKETYFIKPILLKISCATTKVGNDVKYDLETGFYTYRGGNPTSMKFSVPLPYSSVQFGEVYPPGEIVGQQSKRSNNVYNISCYIIARNKDNLYIAFWKLELTFSELTYSPVVYVRSSIEIPNNGTWDLGVSFNSIQLSSCPRINIRAATDIYLGRDLGQVLLTLVGVKTYSVYPLSFQKYILPKELCTLTQKIIYLSETWNLDVFDLEEYILLAGMLRYFLWKLMKGTFTLSILQRKYDTIFYSSLKASEYSRFIEAFTSEPLVSVAQFFVYTL